MGNLLKCCRLLTTHRRRHFCNGFSCADGLKRSSLRCADRQLHISKSAISSFPAVDQFKVIQFTYPFKVKLASVISEPFE